MFRKHHLPLDDVSIVLRGGSDLCAVAQLRQFARSGDDVDVAAQIPLPFWQATYEGPSKQYDSLLHADAVYSPAITADVVMPSATASSRVNELSSNFAETCACSCSIV